MFGAWCRSALFAIAALLSNLAGYGAQAAEPQQFVFARSREAAACMRLGARRSVVQLRKVGDLAALPNGFRVYLVVAGIGAASPPGVLYSVYLDLPAIDRAPQAVASRHYVGAINFYDTAPNGPERWASFDVTDLILRLGRGFAVPHTATLIPDGKPAERSSPCVREIKLVAQRS